MPHAAGGSVKDIAQKLRDYLVKEFIEPEEKRAVAKLQGEVAAAGGSHFAFQRKGVLIDYSFTDKNGNKVDKQWNMEWLHFIVAGYDNDGVGRSYVVFVPDMPKDEVSRNTLRGGLLRVGQDDVVARVVSNT